MSRRILIAGLAAVLLAAAGWALAQQGQQGQPPAQPPGQPAPQPKAKGPFGGGGRFAAPARYAVCPSGQAAVLLETATGRTWVLAQGADGDSVWLPARRLDTDREARQWLQKERERAAEREAVQREMARKVVGLQREMAAKLETLQREMSGAGKKGGGTKGPAGPPKGRAELLEQMRSLTPAQRRDRINMLPEERRDRVLQMLRKAGLEVAD